MLRIVKTQHKLFGHEIAAAVNVRPQTVWTWLSGKSRIIPPHTLNTILGMYPVDNMP